MAARRSLADALRAEEPELEIVLFTIVGVALYFAADWALRALERFNGAPLPYRNVIYFVIILALALASFEFLERIGPR